MAKPDDQKPTGWDAPPPPLRSSRKARKGFDLRQLSIRHLMFALVYFAIVFWAGKRVLDTNTSAQQIILGLLVGLGVCVFGLWAAMKMTRFAFLGWIIFFLGYLGIMVATTSYLAIVTLPIILGAIIHLNSQRRANDQESLLWVLAVAADRGMSLDPGVQALSSQVTGIFEVWTEALADHLRRGAALPEVLDAMPRLVPRGQALLIRMGWDSGRLAQGLRQAIDSRDAQRPIYRSIRGKIAYLSWVLTLSAAVIGYLMYRVIPQFTAIFRDFGIELPRATILVIDASRLFVETIWVNAFIVLCVLGFLAIRLSGAAELTIPIFDRLLARRHAILILRALSVVVEAGRPVGPALYSLAQWYPTRWVSRRLQFAADRVHLGSEWTEALRYHGLLSRYDIGVLDASRRVGNLPWALRELADTAERRLGYRLLAWTQFVFVVAMLLMGGLVFLIAVAYFSPLTTLILKLSQ